MTESKTVRPCGSWILRAQRLAVSEVEERHFQPLPVGTYRGAQRLAASEVWTRLSECFNNPLGWINVDHPPRAESDQSFLGKQPLRSIGLHSTFIPRAHRGTRFVTRSASAIALHWD